MFLPPPILESLIKLQKKPKNTNRWTNSNSKKSNKMKIANRISLYFLVAGLIITIGAASYFYNEVNSTLKESIYNKLTISAELRLDHINTYLNMLEISVGQLSKSPTLEDFLIGFDVHCSKEELFKRAEKRLIRTKEANPAIAEFLLTDDKGKVVASSNKDSIGQDKSTDSLFLDGQKSVFIKDIYYSEMYNQPLLAVSAPILDSETNHFLGVLCARVKLDYLNTICTDRTGLGETGEIYLVNNGGYMITPSRFIEGSVLKLKVPLNYHTYKENTVNHYPDYRNIPNLGVHLAVPRMNWSLISEIDESEAFAPLKRIRIIFISIIVLVILASLVLGRFVALWIAKPIEKLEKGAEIIGGGNLDYKTSIDSNDEVGHLSRAFDSMTLNLKKSTTSIDSLNIEIAERKKLTNELQELQVKDHALAIIIDSANDAIVGKKTDGTITSWNKAAEQIYGYRANEIIGKNISTLIPSEMPDELPFIIKKITNNEVVEHYETIRKTKEGKLIDISLNVSPIRDTNDKIVGLSAISREITERKKAEEKIKLLLKEKEIILKEVHHRIKNNMSIVSGLLMLQAASMKDQSAINALNDAQNRLLSMSVLYDKLYRSESFNEISLKEYLEKLVDEVLFNLSDSSHISIEKYIEDITISTKTSFSVGIIINELLTNIMKYAFKGRDKGTVTISASKKDDSIIIIVQDDGVGMSESLNVNHPKGFGLNLVDMMAKQINGTIQIENHNGTKFTLEFPV